jgi:hypothetical protein
MKYLISFLESAEQELFDSIEYYNKQAIGLGFEFALEVQKTIERIIKYPEAWAILSTKTRKCRCNRFPYSLVYSIKNNTIIIVSVMHSKREPNYWRKRIDIN